jgi:hypothetical protein
MDQFRLALRQQVDLVNNTTGVPDHVKVIVQNFAGGQYYQHGIAMITVASNQSQTLSPFANMNSTINVDFHAFDGNNLQEVVGNVDYRRFAMNVDVEGVQLVQARLYTLRDLVGRYVTQKQMGNAMPAFKNLFRNFVTTLREKEGAMSCAGVPNNHQCNKSNIIILICKIDSGGQTLVCGVPFCKGHAKTRSGNRNKPILAGKRIYLLGDHLMQRFNSDEARTTASSFDTDDQLLVEEDESVVSLSGTRVCAGYAARARNAPRGPPRNGRTLRPVHRKK